MKFIDESGSHELTAPPGAGVLVPTFDGLHSLDITTQPVGAISSFRSWDVANATPQPQALGLFIETYRFVFEPVNSSIVVLFSPTK
jgi:hypothetical protein